MTYYSRILHLVEVLRYEKGTMREDIKVWVQNHLEQHRRALALSCLVGVFLILPFGVRKFCETPERDIRKRVEEEARRATSAAQIITPDSETPSASAILLSAVTTGWKQGQAGWVYLNAAGERERGKWILGANNRYYYLNAAGIMEYGEFLRLGSSRYHLEQGGAMSIGRFYQGDREYYAAPDGALYRDTWVQEGENWCYVDAAGRILKDRMTPDSYYVDASGYLVAAPGSRFEGFAYENDGVHQLYLNLGTADVIRSYLKARGWTESSIAGLLGNFQQESGINPALEEAGTHYGYGLGQWSFDRRERLEAYCRDRGKPYDDLITQLEFLLQEPGEHEFVSRYAKTNWSSPAAAAIEWGIRWERYNLSDLSMSHVRIPYAEAYYAHYVHGVSFLVSNTKYEEPKALMAVASAANAEVNAEAVRTETDVPASAEETQISEGETAVESTAAAEQNSGVRATPRGGSGSIVRKAKEVTAFETEENRGPGVETAAETAATSEESTQ